MKVKQRIYAKDTGCRPWFRLSELEFDIQPDDIIEIDYDPEGHYSENNSWDPYSRIIIYRERDETPEETQSRLEKEQRESKYRKTKRYEMYLNLKKEFDDGL